MAGRRFIHPIDETSTWMSSPTGLRSILGTVISTIAAGIGG
jgi:hypothetical protein